MPEERVIAFSSNPGRMRVNQDGTVNVYCKVCKRFIASVSENNRFYSAVCVFCEAAERGETISAENAELIQLTRLPDGRQLPVAVVSPTPLPDPMVGEEAVIGRQNYFFRAITKIAAIAKALVNPDPESKQLAKSKRRSPVLKGGIEINLNKNE